jgi:3-methyladenine DNA glycosylase AlkD
MNQVIENLRSELISNADEKVKRSGERFFREAVRLYGIRSSVVIRKGKDHYKFAKDKSKTELKAQSMTK